MVKDLLPKAEIITVGTSEEEMKKPFVEDLYETPEERARLEAERDEILKQLSNDDVDFDLSKARKIGTIGDQTVYVEDCGIDFDALLQARALETLAKLESGESGGRVSYVESLESGEVHQNDVITINVKKSSISIQTELCIRLLKQKAVAQEWLLTL